MTQSLWDFDVQALLRPAMLLSAREVLADPARIPNDPGIYAWWFDDDLPTVPREETLVLDNHRLLYVGIAPRAPSRAGSISGSTLRKRIVRNHLGSRIASSTLRRSLAWLLREQLAFHISRNSAGKAAMERADEYKLTTWICEHAAISFLRHNRAWEVEDYLIRNGPALPLNLRGSNHPFRQQLSELRLSAG